MSTVGSVQQTHRVGAASYTHPIAPDRRSCATRWRIWERLSALGVSTGLRHL